MNRKDFLKGASASVILASLGISLNSCGSDDALIPANPKEPIEIDLSIPPFSDLKTEDSWLLHPSEDILLVNVGGDIRAFSSVCTHSGCSRDWLVRNSNFNCTCHSSSFDFNGRVTSGPASRSLSTFNTNLMDDLLILS